MTSGNGNWSSRRGVRAAQVAVITAMRAGLGNVGEVRRGRVGVTMAPALFQKRDMDLVKIMRTRQRHG